MRINAFCTNLKSAGKCDAINFCGKIKGAADSVAVYKPVGEAKDGEPVYIADMSDEIELERAVDYIVSTKARAIVRAAYELTEAGIIEARYKLSPIMLLHKLGVSEYCIVAGGVCLDNDDLDLMAQEGMALVVTPTASAGYGHGFAPVCAAIARGIRVGIGTFDGKYNRNAGIEYEAEFLRLAANAEMRSKNAISDESMKKILSFA